MASDEEIAACRERVEATLARAKNSTVRSNEEPILRTMEEERRAAERPLVCKEAPAFDLVRKVHINEPIETASASDWDTWLDAAFTRYDEAVGKAIAEAMAAERVKNQRERERELAALRAEL